MGIVAGLGTSLVDKPGGQACIKLVLPNELNEVWPQVVRWLEQERAYWDRYYSLEDIYLMLFCEPERYQLWLVGEWLEAFGFFITELRVFPKCKMLVFLLTAAEQDGVNKLSAGDFYHEEITLWAKEQGATWSRIEGREGWKKIGKQLGYSELRIAMTKSLEHTWRQ